MKLRHHVLAAALPAASLLAAMSAARADSTLFSHIQAPRGAAFKAVDANAPMRVLLTLPLRDEAAASAFGRSVSDPNSAQYGRYITPDEFARRFGGDRANYASLRYWGVQHGLSVGRPNKARTVVSLGGTTGQFAALFKTQFAVFDGPNGPGRLMVKSPTLPDGLAGKIDGVVGLENAGSKAWLVRPAPRDSAVSNVGHGVDNSGYSPADLRKIYDVPAQAPVGKTEVLALFEQGGYLVSDLTTYEKAYKLPNVPVKRISVDGSPTGDNAYDLEVDLDIDAVIGMNPDLKQVLMYIDSYKNDSFQTALVDSFDQIADDNLATVVSVSYGQDENQQGLPAIHAEHKALLQEEAQGITVFASSGDFGAEGSERSGLNAPDPGSQPSITCVGGTRLKAKHNEYVSETVWNHLLQGGGATGGGVSEIWNIPYWQKVMGTSVAIANGGSATMRNVPDIAADADSATGYSIYDVRYGGWMAAGGTSLSAPLWASWATLINATRVGAGKARLGFFNPYLYRLGEKGVNFHDITQGDNGSPGYTAGPGYDNDTGWGSIDVADLLTQVK